jgi:hypothetical protein
MRVRWIGAAAFALAGSLALAQPARVQAPDEAELYEIDVESSEIYWLVYKGEGAISQRLGHNHVVSVSELSGQVLLHPELEQSRFEMEIPVESLVVDDPELRAKEGDEFSSTPSEDDIAGTRRNMLSESVLDAENHPYLRISGTGPVVEGGEQRLEVTIELLGRSIPVTVPTELVVEDGVLEASGTFRLTHEQLGMKPFSFMRVLSVGEPLDFYYRIVAHRSSEP